VRTDYQSLSPFSADLPLPFVNLYIISPFTLIFLQLYRSRLICHAAGAAMVSTPNKKTAGSVCHLAMPPLPASERYRLMNKTTPQNHYSLSFPVIDLKKQLPEDFAKVNEYYRILIEILRSKLPQRIPLDDHQRIRLATAALEIKNCVGQQSFFSLDLLFSPDTLLRSYRDKKAQSSTYNNTPKKSGRPPVTIDTINLTLKLANENGWGYERIAAELKKLGHGICPNTLKNIIIKNGIPPSGKRKSLSWKTFILSHLDVTWACDYFTENILTPAGFMACYTLFFIHLGSRKVHIAGCTYNPDAKWVSQQARYFSMVLADHPQHPCKYLIHDNDSSLIALDTILECDGIKIKKTSIKSPWQNGYAERFVRECREVIENMIILGRHHLYYIVKKIEHHHNFQRPHQGLNNLIPLGYEYPKRPAALKDIGCDESLGGMLKHYYVKKAA
jgi:putative transposase